MFCVDLTSEWYDDAMVFRVYICIFCLETTLENLDENDLL